MTTIDVTLLCGKMTAHRQQIYTGFSMLARQGAIRLRQAAGSNGVAALVHGQRVFFDVDDGAWVDDAEFELADVYFKRSYLPRIAAALPGGDKIRPLGLNFAVYPDWPDPAGALRSLRFEESLRQRVAGTLRALRLTRTFVPRVAAMRAAPQPDLEPRVLFLTRAWQPKGTTQFAMPERDELNDARAACIARIRSEFGARALAGFSPSPYVARHYPGLEARVATDQRAYIRQLAEHPVCVATTGLHGSTGWKMAEYVAFSRAIVSEPLNYQAPHFEAGYHYLEFRDAETCIEAIGRLFDDAALRRRVMHHNEAYYESWLRPDRLLWNALTGLASSEPVALPTH